jgi:acid phosphatase (class A)
MGSMWFDAPEDDKIYYGQQEDVLPFDASKMTNASGFPESRWGADFQSLLWILDFTTYDFQASVGMRWQQYVRRNLVNLKLPPAVDSQDMKDGLKDLVYLQQTRRVGAMQEILAQNSDFQPYFCSQLGIYPRSHPKTYLMLKGVARVGELVMVYLKRFYRLYEPRPSQLYPRLTPPVAVPPHASYPSGHAMISQLLALAAKDLVSQLGDPAEELASRIAKNREIAGLHYFWDSAAGQIAAGDLYDLIKRLSIYSTTRNGNPGQQIPGAIDEW